MRTLFVVALVLAVSAAAASASRLSVSHRPFRVVWSTSAPFDRLNFFAASASENYADCDVTLEGSFHSNAIVKNLDALIGHVSRAILGTCAFGGQVRAIAVLGETLPWHVRYGGFSGSLPDEILVTLALVDASFNVRSALGVACLYRSTARDPARFIADGNRSGTPVTELIAWAASAIPLSTGGFGCFSTSSISGSGRISQLGNTNTITLALI